MGLQKGQGLGLPRDQISSEPSFALAAKLDIEVPLLSLQHIESRALLGQAPGF